MSWFKFGKEKTPPPAAPAPAEATPQPAQTTPAAEILKAGQTVLMASGPPLGGGSHRVPTPETIEVFDEFGRPLQVKTEDFRTNILPGGLKLSWSDPDKLYGQIVQALKLNMAADVLPAARHLAEIDTNPERSSVILAIVLRDLEQFAEAEEVLRRQVAARGESGIVLVNLAKLEGDQGHPEQAERTLWRAVQLAPNDENGLNWYGAMMRDRSRAEGRGDAGWEETMAKVAELPGTWRPQLWLARAALERNDAQSAFRIYRVAVEQAPKPIPTDLLQQMSGDLGNKGLLDALVQTTLPFYDAKVHGLAVGNNLIKALLGLGRFQEASKLLEELAKLDQLSWIKTLRFWETEIRKAELAATPAADAAAIEVQTYTIVSPMWLPEEGPARALFPVAAPDAPRVVFFVATMQRDQQPEMLKPEMADRGGRLTRMWGIYAAEWAGMHLACAAATFVPYLKDRGFGISASAMDDTQALQMASHVDGRFAVTAHLVAASEDFALSVRVLRRQDDGSAALLATFDAKATWMDAGVAVTDLLIKLQYALAGAISACETPPRYTIPPADRLPDYLLRLEQLLAVLCAGDSARTLSGEREIVQGMLQLAVNVPASVPVRLVLLETLRRMQKIRPEIVEEMRTSVKLLETRYPLGDPAADAIVHALTSSVYPPPTA